MEKQKQMLRQLSSNKLVSVLNQMNQQHETTTAEEETREHSSSEFKPDSRLKKERKRSEPEVVKAKSGRNTNDSRFAALNESAARQSSVKAVRESVQGPSEELANLQYSGWNQTAQSIPTHKKPQ